MKIQTNGLKGFFFTGAVAILLVLLIASTTLWVLVANSQSARAPLLTQGQQLQNFQQSLMSYDDRVLYVAAEYALYETGENVPPNGYSNMNALKTDFCGGLETLLDEWADEVEILAKDMGLILTITFNPAGCQISMHDFRTVKASYPGTYSIEDTASGAKVEGELPGEAFIDINGFTDPLLRLEGNGALKPILFNPDIGVTPGALAPDGPITGVRGKGWFYGKTTRFTSPSSDCAASKKKCIAVITTVPADPSPLNDYGAVILRAVPGTGTEPVVCGGNPPTNANEDTGKCLDCLRYLPGGDIDSDCTPALGAFRNQISVPFIALAPNQFPMSNIDSYYLIDSSEWRNTVNGDHNIWNIEKLRAMSVCGFYVNNGEAPDFLQRMLATWESEASSHGIETIIFGQDVPPPAWGADNNPGNGATVYSSIDHLLYETARPEGTKIKGMPGCRDWNQCSADTPAGQGSPIGHVAMDSSVHVGDYGVAQIICATGASCEENA